MEVLASVVCDMLNFEINKWQICIINFKNNLDAIPLYDLPPLFILIYLSVGKLCTSIQYIVLLYVNMCYSSLTKKQQSCFEDLNCQYELYCLVLHSIFIYNYFIPMIKKV
jgi:hypothetical protein